MAQQARAEDGGLRNAEPIAALESICDHCTAMPCSTLLHERYEDREMERRMTWDLFRSVAFQIFLGSIQGIVIGACAGAAIGVFFFIIGAIFGAIIAIPFGFFAGLTGMTLGGRQGWAFGGAASLVVPIVLFSVLNATGRTTVDSVSVAVFILVAAAYGGGIGYWYGGRAPQPSIEVASGIWVKRKLVTTIPLYDIPLAWRVLAFIAILATVVGVARDVVAYCAYIQSL